MSQKWLSIVEYARAFNISDMTIRRRIKTGKLSATLKEGKYFIPVDEETLAQAPSSQNPPSHPLAHSTTHPTHQPNHSPHNYHHHGPAGVSASLAARAQNNTSPYYAAIPATPTEGNPPPPAAALTPQPTSSSTHEFINICQRFMSHIGQQNQDLKASYDNKILYLEKTLELKDLKITELNQKIEDLQLLVEMFEGKKPPHSHHLPPRMHS